MKEKVLVILPVIPYPLNAGGSVGVFNMLKAMSSEFDVHVWFMIRQGRKYLSKVNEFDTAIGNCCKIHYTIKKKGFNTPTVWTIYEKIRKVIARDKQSKRDRTLWGPIPKTHFSAQNIIDINKIINDNCIDIVQIEFNTCLDFVYSLPQGVKKVFIHHEILFMRFQRILTNLTDVDSYDYYQYNKRKAEEITALNQFDCVITLSETDKRILANNGVYIRIEPSPLFIPKKGNIFPVFKPACEKLVFLASGSHICNIDGLTWFIKYIHPLLSCRITYILDVVGASWESYMRQNNIPNNINFCGFVEDLESFIPGHIMVVPILSGSGMRMKILESVNNSVPFVSTTVGAEGMGFEDGMNCFIADDPESFVESIVKLLQNDKLQKSFVDKSRSHYIKYFSSEALSRKRIDILRSLIR